MRRKRKTLFRLIFNGGRSALGTGDGILCGDNAPGGAVAVADAADGGVAADIAHADEFSGQEGALNGATVGTEHLGAAVDTGTAGGDEYVGNGIYGVEGSLYSGEGVGAAEGAVLTGGAVLVVLLHRGGKPGGVDPRQSGQFLYCVGLKDILALGG